MNIANEAITYFRHNEVSRENIDDFSLYLNGMGYIDYKIISGRRISEDGTSTPINYPSNIGEIIEFYEK
jgi:hypothetical protein